MCWHFRICYYRIISSVNNNSITPFFEFFTLFVFFLPCYSAILSRNHVSRHLCLVPTLRGQTFSNISPFSNICQDTFYQNREVRFYSLFAKIFTMTGCWILPPAVSIEMTRFPSFILLKVVTYTARFLNAKSSLHCRKEIQCGCNMRCFCVYCWLCSLIFSFNFLISMFMRNWPPISFPAVSLSFLPLSLVSRWCWLHKMNWEVFFFCFLEEFV